jgi:hypothetical protein
MLQMKRQVQERQIQSPDRARELRTALVSKTIASLGRVMPQAPRERRRGEES